MRSWGEFLDDIEARLDAHEGYLSRRGSPPSPFPPPGELDMSHLGPLPLELAPRARLLLARTWAMTGQIRDAMGNLLELSQRGSSRGSLSSRPPVFLDKRA